MALTPEQIKSWRREDFRRRWMYRLTVLGAWLTLLFFSTLIVLFTVTIYSIIRG